MVYFNVKMANALGPFQSEDSLHFSYEKSKGPIPRLNFIVKFR